MGAMPPHGRGGSRKRSGGRSSLDRHPPQLSRDLGVHLARRGVRVNALILGPIETPELRALFDRIGEEERARRFVHYPMGRLGRPNELAGTVAYLASDDAGFVTGAAFPLDGGITSAFTVPT